MDWVKRLGQWHVAEDNAEDTVCGMPMLGNNYWMVIPIRLRIKCKDGCWTTRSSNHEDQEESHQEKQEAIQG